VACCSLAFFDEAEQQSTQRRVYLSFYTIDEGRAVSSAALPLAFEERMKYTAP
jgi:hypothetical protein